LYLKVINGDRQTCLYLVIENFKRKFVLVEAQSNVEVKKF
jgi:hypothetical protein